MTYASAWWMRHYHLAPGDLPEPAAYGLLHRFHGDPFPYWASMLAGYARCVRSMWGLK